MFFTLSLTVQPKHRLGRGLFLLKNRFLAIVLSNLNRSGSNLHTPIVVQNTLVSRLDRDRRVGGSRPNENDYVSVILVTHTNSYIETTDRRDFDGKPPEWRWRRVLSWKIPQFYSVGGARSKTAFFSRFRVPFDYPAHSLQETVLLQINGTNRKPILWRCAFY